MSYYDCDTGADYDFAAPSASFSVATTPLSELGAGGDFDARVNVNDDYGEVHDDGDGDDEEEQDDDTDPYEERYVEPDGSVVIVMRASGGGGRGRKPANTGAKDKVKRTQSRGPRVVKLTRLAAEGVATVVQPPSRALAPGAIQTGDWSAGLCGCLDYCTPNCCMVTFCPCISTAQIATRIGFQYTSILLVFGFLVGIDLITYALTVSTMNQSDSYTYYSRGYYYRYRYSTRRLTVWGYIAIVVTIVTCLAFVQLRSKVRERFRLPGSVAEDLCVSCFCPCCSLAQMATHVKSYKPGSCDFGPPDELPAYH